MPSTKGPKSKTHSGEDYETRKGSKQYDQDGDWVAGGLSFAHDLTANVQNQLNILDNSTSQAEIDIASLESIFQSALSSHTTANGSTPLLIDVQTRVDGSETNIAAAQATLTTETGRINALETRATNLEIKDQGLDAIDADHTVRISALEGEMDAAEVRLTTGETSATDHDTRITTLEGAGGEDEVDSRLKPLWDAIRDATNPDDIKSYIKEMFELHRESINDVLQSDDPRPALGVLFPLALMLKHGKLSMGVITSEEEIAEARPRRSFRSQLVRPRWKTIIATVVLFALGLLLSKAPLIADTVGSWLLWPATTIFGDSAELSSEADTIFGALMLTGFHAFNIGLLYLLSAWALREKVDPVPE